MTFCSEDNMNITKELIFTKAICDEGLINNIRKVVSHWLAEFWQIKKLFKKEDESNLHSSLSCCKDLTKEIPNKSKSSNAFLKLRKLRLENTKGIVVSHLNKKSWETKSLNLKNWLVVKVVYVSFWKLKLTKLNFTILHQEIKAMPLEFLLRNRK